MMVPIRPSPLSLCRVIALPLLSAPEPGKSADEMEEAPPARLPERGEGVLDPLRVTRAMVLLARRLVRPVDHQRAPLDLVDGQVAPIPAVLAVVPVVAHHEEAARGDDLRTPPVAAPLAPEPGLGVGGVGRRLEEVDVGLVERLSIDVDLLVADLERS